MTERFTDSQRSQQLEDLAKFFHGSLFAMHSIGILYHLHRDANKAHITAHTIGAGYSLMSWYEHRKYSKKLKNNGD